MTLHDTMVRLMRTTLDTQYATDPAVPADLREEYKSLTEGERIRMAVKAAIGFIRNGVTPYDAALMVGLVPETGCAHCKVCDNAVMHKGLAPYVLEVGLMNEVMPWAVARDICSICLQQALNRKSMKGMVH